jgi:mitogen-activated protein kinase 1/3
MGNKAQRSEKPPESGYDTKQQAAAPSRPSKVTLPRTSNGWTLPDHYEVIKNIGKGSYGSVAECYDKKKEITVAAKQLKGLFEDLVDCKRILREMAILTRLDSDSVVRVHDIVIPESIDSFKELYIVLELCDSDMKKLVRTDVLLSDDHTTTLLYGLLVGLKYIHSAGVFHRDLKPANCLVNQNCEVKICDFGLARAVAGEGVLADDEEEDVAAESEVGPGGPVIAPTLRKKRAMTAHVVTRWYRAPELILMQKGYTEAIDIWSVGCIYAELLQLQDDRIRLSDRGPLFPGGSCFPLSPERRQGTRAKSKGENDQLEMIFRVLGTPTEEEVAKVEREDAKKYLRNSFPARAGEGLRSRFPKADEQAMDLLSNMLRFLPTERFTVNQALDHPLLGSVRDKSREKTAAGPVMLAFESEGNAKGEMTQDQLRRFFGQEMERLKR